MIPRVKPLKHAKDLGVAVEGKIVSKKPSKETHNETRNAHRPASSQARHR